MATTHRRRRLRHREGLHGQLRGTSCAPSSDERERREKEIAKRESQIAEHKAFVERFRAKATKARQAQSKLKAIDRIEIEELPQTSRRYPRFRFQQQRPSGRQVLKLGRPSARAYGDNRVLRGRVAHRHARASASPSSARTGSASRRCSSWPWVRSRQTAGEIEWGYETHTGLRGPGPQGADRLRDRQTLESWFMWNVCPTRAHRLREAAS